jgi:MFS family permease
MIDISKKSYLKYFLFGSLYFTEGLIKVISTLILPLYLNEKGVSPEIITLLIGVTASPMIIKFLWGGIVDYFIVFGRRRFIVIGGVLSIFSIFILTFIDPAIALFPFAILVFISWIGVGFLDVSSDALAIEISKEEERGKINGAMYAGQNIGMASGALILPFITNIFGYSGVFPISALIVFLIIIFPLLVKENIIVKKRQKIGKLLISEFKKKSTIMVCFLAFLITLSSGMILLLAPLYMDIRLQIDNITIGFITMVFTMGTAVGSLFGGVLADRWGRKKALYLLILISVFCTGSLVFAKDWVNFAIIYGLIGFLQGGYIAAYASVLMDFTNPRVGATQFSIYTGIGNFGLILLGALSGSFYAALGFSRVFLFSAWIFGPVLILLFFFRFKSTLGKK